MAGLAVTGSEGMLRYKIPEMLRDALDSVRQEPEAVVSLYEAAVTSKVTVPRHEMHGVVYAHIEMQQPIKAFQQIVDICEAGHTPVPRIMESVANELCPNPNPSPSPSPNPNPHPLALALTLTPTLTP